MRCQAICVPERGKPKAELREYEVADPKAGELTVEIKATLISPGTERAFSLGLPNTDAKFPYHPGYCASGVVVKAGPGATRAKEGQRVVVRLGHRSAWTVHERDVLPLLDGIPPELGGFVILGQIGAQAVRRARLELGESAMVLGLGIIGQLALQMAKIAGGLPVVGVERVAKRLDAARACGADAVLDSGQNGWPEELKRLTAGGPHVVLESTGAPEPVGVALGAVRRFGRVVLLASTRGESTVNFYRDVHSPGVTILGAHAWAVPTKESHPGVWTMDDEIMSFQRYLAAGRLTLEPLVTGRVAWRDAPAAYDAMLTWNTDMIGTLILWR